MTLTSEAPVPAWQRPAGHRRFSAKEFLVAAALIFAVYALSPNLLPHGDGFLSIPTAESLIHDGDINLHEYHDVPSVEHHYAMTHLDGREVDEFPWMTSLVAVPVVAVVDLVSLTGLTPSTDTLIRRDQTAFVQLASGALIAAAAAVALALSCLRLLEAAQVGFEPKSRWARRLTDRWPLQTLTVVVGLTTPLWSVVSRSLRQHGPSMLCLSLALIWTLPLLTDDADRPGERAPQSTWIGRPWLAGFVCGMSYWFRPTNAVACVTVLAFYAWSIRHSLWRFALGLATAGVAGVVANLAFVGRIAQPYFAASRVGYHKAYFDALAANLASPARGLLVFCPFLLLGLATLAPSCRRAIGSNVQRFLVLCAVTALGYLVGVSGFPSHWWAGHTFGPRFMSESLPFLVPIAVLGSCCLLSRSSHLTRGRRRLTATLVAALWLLSGAIHLQGGVFHSTECWNGVPVDIDTHPSRVWSVSDLEVTAGLRTAVHRGLPAALWTSCATLYPGRVSGDG
jgi:hypothetical protein